MYLFMGHKRAAHGRKLKVVVEMFSVRVEMRKRVVGSGLHLDEQATDYDVKTAHRPHGKLSYLNQSPVCSGCSTEEWKIRMTQMLWLGLLMLYSCLFFTYC